MSYLELGLKEAGLWDRVSAGCKGTGLSVVKYLGRLINSASLTEISLEKEDTVEDSAVLTIFNKIENDPQYFYESMIRANAEYPRVDFTSEEARGLCQD